MRGLQRAWRVARRLLTDDRGLIALKFALMVPGVAVLGLGAVDLHAVYSDKQRMQDIADSAALAGARELGLAVDESGPENRAQAYVEGQISGWRHGPRIETTVATVELEGQRALRVRLDGNRPSFFGNLLPPGGWNLAAESTATSVAIVPLCVLAHGDAGSKIIEIKDRGQIRAPACLIHSNQDITVERGTIEAALTQAVTSATGPIDPAPLTNAMPIRDPFSDLELTDSRGRIPTLVDCVLNSLPARLEQGTHYLPAGVHCNGIDVRGTARLELGAGEHWFLDGSLTVRERAEMTGRDVVLFFNKRSKFVFADRARVNLDGRRTGRFAGMVMVGTRDNTQEFVISADHVESLLGVIYVPAARLVVEGRSEVARESAWTVIVARSMEIKGSPQLFINADYEGSGVPVPAGVGPRQGGSRLVD